MNPPPKKNSTLRADKMYLARVPEFEEVPRDFFPEIGGPR